MARKPPAAVRAALPHRHERTAEVPQITGLSAGTMQEIRRYERSHLSPGAVARAVADWRRTVHQPAAQLVREAFHAGCPCCDSLAHRDLLARVLPALGARGRRELRATVEPLDDVFERRTTHDPLTPAEWPWWRRRT